MLKNVRDREKLLKTPDMLPNIFQSCKISILAILIFSIFYLSKNAVFPLCKISILTILIFLVYKLLKYAIKRQQYCKIIPSLGLRFTNVLGHLGYFPFSYSKRGWNGYSKTTYFQEFVKAHFYLFKKEHVTSFWIGYFPLFLLNSPEAVQQLLNGTKTIEKAVMYNWLRCCFGDGIAISHGKKWKTRRKQLTRAFHFEKLKDFLPVLNENSQKLVEILEKDTTKDFTNIEIPLQLCTLDITCQTNLGVNINAQENNSLNYVESIIKLSDAIALRAFNVLSWFDFTYFLTAAGRAIKKDIKLWEDFTKSVIREREKKFLSGKNEKIMEHKPKRKPFIDFLLELKDETNDLTEDDIREEIETFTFASHDTTSLAMIWTCYLIGLHKDVHLKAHQELDAIFSDDRDRHVTNEDLNDMKYIECIIKESLRLYPSVPAFARKTDEDMIICGYQIPKNSTLVASPYMLHRNEDIFPNPEKFDPDRFTVENSKNRPPYAYIPFSAGPRNCLGQRYAMMKIKTVLSHILRHYTLESLDPRDKVPDCFEITLRPTTNVRIKIRPRNLNESNN